MKAIGYTRCSTHEQVVSGLGLDAQERRIRAYCELQNLELGGIISDPGESGGKPLATRPGGQRFLKAVSARQTQAVVTLKLDRMFRNAGDCLATIEQWDKLGIALHVIDLGGNAIDTTSAAGRFMLVVLAGAAEMERNLTRERTRLALAVKRSNGERVGAVSYGSDLADDGKTLLANAAEQAVIDEMRAMRAKGWTLQAIAEELTELGVPTKKKRSRRWTHQAVAGILKRESA